MVYSRSKPTIFSLFLLSSLTASSTTFCSSSNACPKISSSCYTKEKKCCSPKTIMTPRSFVEDSTLSDALTFYEKYKSYYAENSHKKHSSTILNATPFYQVSTRGNKLASLFLPTCNSCVTVKEDGTGDVGALWPSVIDPVGDYYSSLLKLSPQRQTLGVLFQYSQDLSSIWRGLWIQAKLAVAQAKHTIHGKEKLLSEPGTIPGAQTALEYLASNALNYGRIACGTYSKGGIDDLQFTLGTNIFHGKTSHLDIYVAALAPTSAKEDPTYLFAPQIGRGRHAGVGAGFNGGWEFWSCKNHSLSILTDFTYEYLFQATEKRSFDLKNGPWSRYLQVVSSDNLTATQPAINFLTQPANVTPKGRVNWWLAAHHDTGRFQTEVGYNFWWKQQEQVCLSSCASIPASLGIADITGYATNAGYFTSASTALISNGVIAPHQAVSDPAFTPITLSDLNIQSAQEERAITNKIYAACGYDISRCGKKSLLLGLGSSYEFACKNNDLEQWGIWGNITFKF